MMYWLPKLHKRPYKARFIANSSSCTTTELSKLLTSCLTAVKNHVIRYCEKVYERSGKNLFWSIKNSGEVLNKLKSRRFRATSLSTYDFSTLYTPLLHNLIKEKLINLIEWTFKRECSPFNASNETSRKLLRIIVTPDLHLTYSENGGNLGLVLKMKNVACLSILLTKHAKYTYLYLFKFVLYSVVALKAN